MFWCNSNPFSSLHLLRFLPKDWKVEPEELHLLGDLCCSNASNRRIILIIYFYLPHNAFRNLEAQKCLCCLLSVAVNILRRLDWSFATMGIQRIQVTYRRND